MPSASLLNPWFQLVGLNVLLKILTAWERTEPLLGLFVWNTLVAMTEGLSLTEDSACGEHVRPFSGSPPERLRAHHGLNAYSVDIVIWRDS